MTIAAAREDFLHKDYAVFDDFLPPEEVKARGSSPSVPPERRNTIRSIARSACDVTGLIDRLARGPGRRAVPQSAWRTMAKGPRSLGRLPGKHGEIPCRLGGYPGCGAAMICNR